jgi:hypothetical protein
MFFYLDPDAEAVRWVLPEHEVEGLAEEFPQGMIAPLYYPSCLKAWSSRGEGET